MDECGHLRPMPDAETVALVRGMRKKIADLMRGFHKLSDTCTDACLAADCAAADAWLAAHEKPAERWEPCAGEHVEMKDGQWLRLLPDSAETYTICDGEHRRRHSGCCCIFAGTTPDGTELVRFGQGFCAGVGWESKAS